MMTNLVPALLLSALFGLTGVAQAVNGWTGSFVITQLCVCRAENLHVRASGLPAISAYLNGPGRVYINQSQSGSKEYSPALMIAYASGKPANVYWRPDANGCCQIIEMTS